ncbi:MAG: hypothetical protein ABIF01_00775 [Candidatus Micrarchaeota archaeon]
MANGQEATSDGTDYPAVIHGIEAPVDESMGKVSPKTEELKQALRSDEGTITVEVLKVVYLAAPWAEHSSPFPEQRKEDVIRVLLEHMLQLDSPEKALLAGEIVKIAGEVNTKKVPLVLLNPDLGRWHSIQTGEQRTWAVLEILRKNPGILQDPVAAKEILAAAQETCRDLGSHISIGRIAQIAAMTGDPGQRDHMIFHVNAGLAAEESARALGKLKYHDFDSAIPAIIALNDLKTRSNDTKLVNIAETAVLKAVQTQDNKLYQTNLEFRRELNPVLKDSGMGWWNRWRTRSLIARNNIRDTQELKSKLAVLIRSGHPVQRARGIKGIKAANALIQMKSK